MEEPTRVLVAEDSATLRAAVRIQLTARGFEVVEAENGAEALAAARTHNPDVALLDLEMPGMDGRQTLSALQADADLAGIPVVFLTGRTDPEEMVACLEAGAHDYVRKPVEGAELVARVMAAARVKQLQDELRRQNAALDVLSRVDALTGLYNRRHLEERLGALASGSRRHRFPVSVMLIDIDHFKSVNDTHGHETGDRALQAVARVLRTSSREEDVAGRWGGEEFMLVLPYTDLPGTCAAAERVRAGVATAAVTAPGGARVCTTVSVGVAVAVGASSEELVRRADGALYEAKAAGRNQVVVEGRSAEVRSSGAGTAAAAADGTSNGTGAGAGAG